jgi:plastocyanin
MNEDSATHTATSSGNAPIDSGNLMNGQSYTVTFTKAGTYKYICSIHPYMNGTIVVQ